MPQFLTNFGAPRGRPLLVLLLSSALIFAVGCSTFSSSTRSGGGDTSYLELQVQPSTAEIYIDDEYHGQVDRWRHQTVPIQPGPRRLELRADGHITQRFDLDIDAGELLTLTLRLEPSIGSLDDDGSKAPESQDVTAPPPFPGGLNPDPLDNRGPRS